MFVFIGAFSNSEPVSNKLMDIRVKPKGSVLHETHCPLLPRGSLVLLALSSICH